MSLEFYKALNYPVPSPKAYFMHQKKQNLTDIKSTQAIHAKNDNQGFSRTKKNQYLDEYIAFIDKYHWLYRSIPGISRIYLCNSLTFNALHQNSDIDLFIVAKPKRIWRSKFWATLLFSLM